MWTKGSLQDAGLLSVVGHDCISVEPYDTMLNMSILYDKRLKKAFKWIWIVFAVIIIISMVFAFSGGAGPV